MTYTTSNSVNKIFDSDRFSIAVVTGIFVFIAVLGIGQDFINSRINDNSFYLSESSLYKVIWLLFVPLIFLGVFLIRKMGPQFLANRGFYVVLFSMAFPFFHLFIASLSIYLLSSLLLDHNYATLRVFRYFISEDLHLVLFIYTSFFIFNSLHRTAGLPANRDRKKDLPHFIPVSSNNKIIPVPVRDILYIKSDRPYIALVTRDSRFLYPSSLKKMLTLLDGRDFVRTHRSTIVNINHIASIKSRHNGDYDLFMKNGDVARMSRNYRGAFKSRMQHLPPLSR